VGTALPESAVTLVAAVGGHGAPEQGIAVGAAMGGPLALSTIAYAVAGLTLLVQRRQPEPEEYGDLRKLRRDQMWFLAIFVVKVGLGLVAFAVKPWLGLLFFAAYAVYFWWEIRVPTVPDALGEALEPLRIQRGTPHPATRAIVGQTLVTVAVVFGASQLFVRQLEAVAPLLGLPATATALLLSPVATELPETLNALIWVRQGKTRLALANVSGSMMIQATVPSGLGLLFTPWRFDRPLLASGIATMAAIGYLLLALRARVTARRLAAALAFYALFGIALIPLLPG
jgi:cation:H+ antiporter